MLDSNDALSILGRQISGTPVPGTHPFFDGLQWKLPGAIIVDDFLDAVGSSGTIGALNWIIALVGSGTVAFATDVANSAIGAKALTTTTSSSDSVAITAGGTASSGAYVGNIDFDFVARLKLGVSSANISMRFGLCTAVIGFASPTSGIYIEKEAADTSWFGVNNPANSETRTAALLSTDTSWHWFRIRRSGDTIYFSTASTQATLGQATETSMSSTASAHTDPYSLFFYVKTHTTSAMSITLDYVHLIYPTVTR